METNQKNEIRQQIASTYMGQIYRLGNQFYDKRGHLKPVDDKADYDELIREFMETCKDDERNKDNLIHNFFYKYSMENMEKSRCNNKDDLFIVGYVMRRDSMDETTDDVE